MVKCKKMSLIKRILSRYINCLINVHDNNNNESRLSSLPIDLQAIILSKLDITTLYHCAVAFPGKINPVLPRIITLSGALPQSMYVPGTRTTFIGRRISNLVSEVIKHDYLLATSVLMHAHYWLNRPRICSSGKQFIRNLAGLESLELEVRPSAYADYFTRHGLWFRWDLKVGIDRKNNNRYYYLVIVIGSILGRQGGFIIENGREDNIPEWTAAMVAACHSIADLAWTSCEFGRPMNGNHKLRRLVIKDTAKNGRVQVDDSVDFVTCLDKSIMMSSSSCCGKKSGGLVYYVPSVMLESLRFRKTYLLFQRWEEVVHQDNDGHICTANGTRNRRARIDLGDLYKDCLRYFKPRRGSEAAEIEEKKELREVVVQILTDDRRYLRNYW